MSVETLLVSDGATKNKSSLHNAGDVIVLSAFYISFKPFSDEQQFAQALVKMARQSGKVPNIRITDKTMIKIHWESVMTSNSFIDEKRTDLMLKPCLQTYRKKLIENGEDPYQTVSECRKMTVKQVTICEESFPIINFAIAVKQ